MSLHPNPIGPIPGETLRVARAAFPRGTVVTRLRDEFAELYRDEDFQALYPRRGQPGLAPWRLALVTVLQFLEHLSDRQAADAVRSRIDWKYALGLELGDPGFHFSVLTEFRGRLVASQAEYLLLDRMLAHFKARGLIKPRGRQRTDSTHVLGAVRDLHLLEMVTETMRAALNELATVAPRWLRRVAEPAWFERYAGVPRTGGCPAAVRRGAQPMLSRSAPTASRCSTHSTSSRRRRLRVKDPCWRPCAWSGRPTSSVARTGRRVGATAPSCRRWANASSRPTTRRCTTAPSAAWSGRATRYM
jgi:transposase